MTLLRELIRIPDRVHRGDFVHTLSQGIVDVGDTLRDYVVTPQLVDCFDAALKLVESALHSGRSRATYLHGSFGSGKSHFMAVLYALLSHEPAARARPELQAVVARHDPWLRNRRFLLVPYHMVGAASMESAVLGGYARRVRELHPEASIPPVYRTELVFEDARRLRRHMGDEAFFAGLGRSGADTGWGRYDARWTAAEFEAALAAPPDDAQRVRLLNDLISSYLGAYTGVVQESTESFVGLDQGLAAISQHAKGLGYDAVVLFLDELVLWLASRMADHAFVAAEAPKVAKLVEAADAHRPIPLVSFIARQRDLRELVGDHLPGAEQLAFADSLKWWEDRFDVIRLEDRNLPLIAEKRVLVPVDDMARRQLDQAFAEVERVRPETWDVLLGGDGGDRAAFRRTYPFSPAFMSVLVAASSALTRERTALRLMLQLLVDQRDELEVGQLVPVGDLFDVIATGDEPFTDAMRARFADAKRLYQTKFRPLLLAQHNLDEDEVPALPRRHPFRNDDRLVKTLLLAALVPEVPALRGLTAARLAALNHGAITTPIPGQEKMLVLAKLRRWAAEVGELRIGDGDDPTISVELVGVDVESILAKVQGVDNVGARRRKVKELIWSQMGVRPPDETLIQSHSFVWRGSRRSIELVFGNIRDPEDLPDGMLLETGRDWRLVIDYPFDDDHGPNDDVNRAEQLRGQRRKPPRTVCWIPSFLSRGRLTDLGRLVKLDHLLAGGRFEELASHLAPQDRLVARQTLESQQSALRARLGHVLQQAYGTARPEPDDVDTSHGLDQHLIALDPSFTPQLPVGGTLKEALEHLLDQLLRHQFPAHPDLDPDRTGTELRPRELKLVLEQVQAALADPDGRVIVEQQHRRLMRRVCNPLRIGEMHEAPFVVGTYWRQHFLRLAGQEGLLHAIPVGRLRAWMDEPKPSGLDRQVQNLIIAVFATQTDRAWVHGGQTIPPPPLESITDELELREQPLPDHDVWEAAVRRANGLFGIPSPSPLRTAGAMASLAAKVRERAGELQPAAVELVAELERHARRLGLDPAATSGRIATARAALELVERLRGCRDDLELTGMLAAAKLPSTDEAVAKSLRTAAEVAARLRSTNWALLEGIDKLADDRLARALDILDALRAAAGYDEFAASLGDALATAEREATRLLTAAPPVTQPRPPRQPPPPPAGKAAAREERIVAAAAVEQAVADLRAFAKRHPGTRLRLTWEVLADDRD
jgi:hypothetical protein